MAEILCGRSILITGAGSGIGRATALAAAREGALLAVSDISEEGGLETVRLARELGSEAFFQKADVSISAEVEALIQITLERFGRLDCAVNNAGISGPVMKRLADLNEAEWTRVIDTNLKGVFLCLKHEISVMLKQGGGSIVNIASILGLQATPMGASAYVASKHGVIGLTRATAAEYARQHIRINAVCPGFIDTPMIGFALENQKLLQEIVSRYPMGRLGRPEEIGEAVVWLCSDRASFVTGQTLVVDGGAMAI